MDIKELDLSAGNMLGFRFDHTSFVVSYVDDGIKKEYGSSGKGEMVEFAKILVKELAICSNEGIVKKTK